MSRKKKAIILEKYTPGEIVDSIQGYIQSIPDNATPADKVSASCEASAPNSAESAPVNNDEAIRACLRCTELESEQEARANLEHILHTAKDEKDAVPSKLKKSCRRSGVRLLQSISTKLREVQDQASFPVDELMQTKATVKEVFVRADYAVALDSDRLKLDLEELEQIKEQLKVDLEDA
ncbi:hypothetical protein BGZ93_006094 [Podila epicladia]|nr:hypothetical protein BGZ93_006094 [Podila epicladia]